MAIVKILRDICRVPECGVTVVDQEEARPRKAAKDRGMVWPCKNISVTWAVDKDARAEGSTWND